MPWQTAAWDNRFIEILPSGGELKNNWLTSIDTTIMHKQGMLACKLHMHNLNLYLQNGIMLESYPSKLLLLPVCQQKGYSSFMTPCKFKTVKRIGMLKC